jgi:hypothetical protein
MKIKIEPSLFPKDSTVRNKKLRYILSVSYEKYMVFYSGREEEPYFFLHKNAKLTIKTKRK